jgi:hypothetical protein
MAKLSINIQGDGVDIGYDLGVELDAAFTTGEVIPMGRGRAAHARRLLNCVLGGLTGFRDARFCGLAGDDTRTREACGGTVTIVRDVSDAYAVYADDRLRASGESASLGLLEDIVGHDLKLLSFLGTSECPLDEGGRAVWPTLITDIEWLGSGGEAADG